MIYRSTHCSFCSEKRMINKHSAIWGQKNVEFCCIDFDTNATIVDGYCMLYCYTLGRKFCTRWCSSQPCLLGVDVEWTAGFCCAEFVQSDAKWHQPGIPLSYSKFFSIILIRNNTNYFYAFLKTVLFLWVRDKQLFKCKIDYLMFCLSFYLIFHILLNTFNFLDTKVCLPTLYLFFVTFGTVVVFWGLLRNIY